MDNLLALAFEAHSREANHHRHYAITLGRDLLDHWTVSIRFGRTGQPGRELRYAAAEPDAIRAIIRDRLRRRLSAPGASAAPTGSPPTTPPPASTAWPGCRTMSWPGSSRMTSSRGNMMTFSG